MRARENPMSSDRSCTCMCMCGCEHAGIQLEQVKGGIQLRAQARKRRSHTGSAYAAADDGLTSLLVASEHGHEGAARICLEYGAAVDLASSRGNEER